MKKLKSKPAKKKSSDWIKELYPDTKILYKDAIKGFEDKCSDTCRTSVIVLFHGTGSHRIAEKIIRKNVKEPDSESIVMRMIGEDTVIDHPDSNGGSNYHFSGKPIGARMKAAYESIIAALSAKSKFTEIFPCYRNSETQELISPMSFKIKYSKRGVESIGDISLSYQTKNSSTFAILSDKNGNPFVTVTVFQIKKGNDYIVLKNQVSIPYKLAGEEDETFLNSQSSDLITKIRQYANDELLSKNPKALRQIQSDIVQIIETAHFKEGNEIVSMKAKNDILSIAQ